jgi:hypothetical protein
VTTLSDINDIHNGVFVNTLIHNGFDLCLAAILKVCHACPPACSLSDPYVATDPQTPNHILKIKDIPPSPIRSYISEDVSFLTCAHYTLQWLVDPGEGMTFIIPNNSNAAFKKNTRRQKPSDVLLHYNYGAAAIRTNKIWPSLDEPSTYNKVWLQFPMKDNS